MSRVFRPGALGALMDEYERAVAELSVLIDSLEDDAFEVMRDRQTQDENCRSIQTVVYHVVRAGYGYADYVRAAFAIESNRPEVALGSRMQGVEQLAAMIAYTVVTLEGQWEIKEEAMSAIEIQSRWGQQYDLEQMLEHAIVHALRHRRQVERFLYEPRFSFSEDH